MSSSFGNTLYKMMNELDTPPNPQDIPCSSPNYSIRRTISADMSSPKWLQQNGFFSSSMKRAQSSEQLQALGEEDSQKQTSDEEKKGSAAFEDIWSSIQSEKQSWSSILSQQKNDGSGSGSGPVPPPYVHPLVRRSTSSLSEKSLEVCTESLGSETGSDVFSYPPSDPEDSDKEVEAEAEAEDNNKVVEEEDEVEEVINECDHEIVEEVPKYKNKYYSGNQGIKTSFPPPLPSLAHRGGGGDGSNLHIMRSHHHDGRLVLEAVSVPSHNCLRAHRRGGRLLLTLANQQEQESEEVIITEEEEKEKEEVTPNGLKNHVHRSSPPTMMIMSKIIGLTSTRNNSTWRRNINATIIRSLDDHHHNHEEEAEKHVSKAASWANSKSSLPPRPKVARRSTTSGPKPKSTATAVTALNAYEYYWRRTTAVAVLKPLAGGDTQQVEKENNNNINNNNSSKLALEHNGKGVSVAKQGVVVVKAGVVATGEKEAEYLVPFLRGCKEPRSRSLLFWEPYCIATS